jgi:putative transport protein
VVLSALGNHPNVALFLVLGFGYLVGKIKAFGFELGPSTGVLLGALVLGHFQIGVPRETLSLGFIFFIYCVGLQAGPQFFGAFREEGGKYLLLALFVALLAVGLAAFLGDQLGLAPGYTAGLMAGALTSTPTLVAAQDAIAAGMADLPEAFPIDEAATNLTASYAITYLFGLIGVGVLANALPRVLRIDLPAEAAKLARLRDTGGRDDHESERWSRANLPILRVYRLERDDPAEQSMSQAEFLERTGCYVARIKRDDTVRETEDPFYLELGDLVCVGGRRTQQASAAALLGPEVVDRELLEQRHETRSIIVTRPSAIGCTPAELGITETNGLFLSEIKRAGMEVPPSLDLTLQKSDVLVVTGPEPSMEQLVRDLGQAERPIHETDLVTFAFGIAAGLVVGSFAVRVGTVPVGLGQAGGLLLVGLIIGFMRSSYPNLGRVPLAARWIFMELGLMFFMAGVGVQAGGEIVEALSESGLVLVGAGVLVTTLPVLLGFAFGHFVLRLHPVILLGALTGATTSTPALSVVVRMAGNSLPSLGYAGTYTFANVFLALAGGLLIRL